MKRIVSVLIILLLVVWSAACVAEEVAVAEEEECRSLILSLFGKELSELNPGFEYAGYDGFSLWMTDGEQEIEGCLFWQERNEDGETFFCLETDAPSKEISQSFFRDLPEPLGLFTRQALEILPEYTEIPDWAYVNRVSAKFDSEKNLVSCSLEYILYEFECVKLNWIRGDDGTFALETAAEEEFW